MFRKKAEQPAAHAAGADPLDAGIREMMRGLQQDQLRELEQRLAAAGPEHMRQLEQRLQEQERAVAGLRRDVEAWIGDVRGAKAGSEAATGLGKRVSDLEQRLAAERERASAAAREQRELVHQAADELRQLRERTEAMAKLETELRSLNAGELRRDVEGIKAKQQWLEQRAPGTAGLEQRLAELEARVARLRSAAPLVLE